MIALFSFLGALVAWLLIPGEKYVGSRLRLKTLARTIVDSSHSRIDGERTGGAFRASTMDEAQILSGLIAQVRNGGQVREYIEHLAGRKFALPHLGVHVFEEAFSRAMNLNDAKSTGGAHSHRRPQNLSHGDPRVHRLSVQVLACVRLSEVLGCPLARSLAIVLRLFRRSKHTDDLRSQAFSMPKATVKLLSALPAVTLLGGEVLGAHPMSFLFGGTSGGLCLVLGLGFYGSGMRWIRSLLCDFTGDEGNKKSRDPRMRSEKEDGKRFEGRQRNGRAGKFVVKRRVREQ